MHGRPRIHGAPAREYFGSDAASFDESEFFGAIAEFCGMVQATHKQLKAREVPPPPRGMGERRFPGTAVVTVCEPERVGLPRRPPRHWGGSPGPEGTRIPAPLDRNRTIPLPHALLRAIRSGCPPATITVLSKNNPRHEHGQSISPKRSASVGDRFWIQVTYWSAHMSELCWSSSSLQCGVSSIPIVSGWSCGWDVTAKLPQF